jgi:hypothetical protein
MIFHFLFTALRASHFITRRWKMWAFKQRQSQPNQHKPSGHAHSQTYVSYNKHYAKPGVRLQHAVSNQSVQQVTQAGREQHIKNAKADVTAPYGQDHRSDGFIEKYNSPNETQARLLGNHARRPPSNTAPLTNGNASNAACKLSAAGCYYFSRLLGPTVERAQLHVDAYAEHLTQLAGAKALTYGNNIFIPKVHFAPETTDGRVLLGHELAHVAQSQSGQPQLFRQPADEFHYPSVAEQHEIERLLSRDFKPTSATSEPSTQTPDQPAKKRGRTLSKQEQQNLADHLKDPYFATLDQLDSGGDGSTHGSLNEDDAFSVTQKARDAIFERYGRYAQRHFTLTRDETTNPVQRYALDQVLVSFSIPPGTVRSVARTLSTTHCATCLSELSQLDDESKAAVIDKLIDYAVNERNDQLQRITKTRVPGSYVRSQSQANLRLKPETEFYQTTVHELIHAMAHPVWIAAFGDEDNINEGFTEYFTQEVVGSVLPSYKTQYDNVVALRDSMRGPFMFASVGGSTEESMRLAFFSGRLDLIGWRPSGPHEEEAVKKAADPNKVDEGKAWDAATAGRYAELYQSEAQAKQSPSRNVLGVGIYFAKGSAGTIAARYARVVARTEPYAKGQLLLEGQLIGSPEKNLNFGASLGLGVEYQDPYFYAQAGARFVGTAATGDGQNRIDISPFAGLGVRAWQKVRIGAEGFVLVPLLPGQEREYGGIATVGIEFK